jgi:hypothetical protein
VGAAISHQTVRIARGRHRSPSHGACVMEVASMLAGERFSDRPRCVDPVLAAYLRAFNDRLGHADRQSLFPFAALAVGTRAGRAAARRRRDRCLAFAGVDVRGHDPIVRAVLLTVVRLRLLVLVGVSAALRLRDGSAELAARSVLAHGGDVDAGFGLIEELLAEGRLEPAPLAQAVADRAQLRVAAAGAQLEVDARRPDGPQQREDADHRGDARDLEGRHAGQRREEDEQDDRSHGQTPEHERDVLHTPKATR